MRSGCCLGRYSGRNPSTCFPILRSNQVLSSPPPGRFHHWFCLGSSSCNRHHLAKYVTEVLLTRLRYILTAPVHLVIIPDMYEVTGVGSGLRMPSANFVTNFNRYMKGEMSILIIFYFGLWAIKLNFLVFFYRLGSQVAYYRKAWWAVTIFTMATFIQCIGTIQYPCLSNSFEYITANCTGEAAIRFQNITLKFNCAVDVLTDMLSMARDPSQLLSYLTHQSCCCLSRFFGMFASAWPGGLLLPECFR